MRVHTSVRLGAAAGLVAALLAVQQLPAQASPGKAASFDDRQVVQLLRPGADRGKGGLALHLTSRDAVVAGNAAVATSSCDGCHATAISFQVVVVDRAPTSLDVGNVAYADNEGCTACAADAFAYQFVLAFEGDATLTGTGRRGLARIDVALSQLSRSGAGPDQIQSEVDGYAAQVIDLLSAELRVRPVVRKVVQKHHGPGPQAA